MITNLRTKKITFNFHGQESQVLHKSENVSPILNYLVINDWYVECFVIGINLRNQRLGFPFGQKFFLLFSS